MLQGIPNLRFLDLSNNDLTTIDLNGNNQLAQINLDFNLINNASIGQVIDQVDAYGTSGFGHILSLRKHGRYNQQVELSVYIIYWLRGWIVRPPLSL